MSWWEGHHTMCWCFDSQYAVSLKLSGCNSVGRQFAVRMFIICTGWSRSSTALQPIVASWFVRWSTQSTTRRWSSQSRVVLPLVGLRGVFTSRGGLCQTANRNNASRKQTQPGIALPILVFFHKIFKIMPAYIQCTSVLMAIFQINPWFSSYACLSRKTFGDTHTHTTIFTALLEFVRDHPGEQVPER